jgi:cell division protein FtsB
MLEKTGLGFMARVKAYFGYLFTLVFVLLLVSFARNIVKIDAARKKVGEAEERVEKLREENQKLEEAVQAVKTEEFVEGQLRDKLGLAKEGETVLVLPDEELLRKLAPKQPEDEELLPDPIWRKWYKLFF